MNILFVDNYNLNEKNNIILNKFGFYFTRFNNKNIYYLNINEKKITDKFSLNFFKFFLKLKFKNKKTYIVLSKYLEENNSLKKFLEEFLVNPIFVSNQNNLYNNDKIYINEYLKTKNIFQKDVKILMIIDRLEKIEKKKLNELLQEYKIVDIYMTNISNDSIRYVNELNNSIGSVVEILDKIPNEYYNIFLVFSKKYKICQNKSSFLLDYNNSDLDVKSNTYLIFNKNKENFKIIFRSLGIDINRFEKTKLGKLYIHASNLILDI